MRYSFENLDHGVSDQECLEVIAYSDWYYNPGPSRDGNRRLMFVGKSSQRQSPIEVGVEYIEEEDDENEGWEHIYHGMEALAETKRKAGYDERFDR